MELQREGDDLYLHPEPGDKEAIVQAATAAMRRYQLLAAHPVDETIAKKYDRAWRITNDLLRYLATEHPSGPHVEPIDVMLLADATRAMVEHKPSDEMRDARAVFSNVESELLSMTSSDAMHLVIRQKRDEIEDRWAETDDDAED